MFCLSKVVLKLANASLIVRTSDVAFQVYGLDPCSAMENVVPEIAECKAILSAPKPNYSKAIELLERASDIFSALPPSPPVTKLLVPIVATRASIFAAHGHLLPRRAASAKGLLEDSWKLLREDAGESAAASAGKVALLCSSMKVLCSADHKHAALPSTPLGALVQGVVKLVEKTSAARGAMSPSLQLEALSVIIAWWTHGNPQALVAGIDGVLEKSSAQLGPTPNEFAATFHGLLLTLRAEALQVLAAQPQKEEQLNLAVKEAYDAALGFFELQFVGGGEAAVEAKDRDTLRDAYTSALLAAGNYLICSVRPPPATPPEEPMFLGMQLSSSLPFTRAVEVAVVDASVPAEMMAIEEKIAKRKAQMYLERALKINRKVAEDTQNAKAGWILRSLACLYAELKDYLYASGLFNSSLKIMQSTYGERSLEAIGVLKLMERFQRIIGSQKEAEVTQRQIEQLQQNATSPQ